MRSFFSILLLILSLHFACEMNGQVSISKMASEARSYCASNKLNTSFCILIDMSIHSGKKRAFIYDLRGDSIICSALCSHGCGATSWSSTSTASKPVFSNTIDSHCTSLGKYRIGKRGYSNWGVKVNYLLYGLEPTNSNALRREIVFHSWEDVPEQEIYPQGTPEGWGCPAVANSFMTAADKLLQKSTTPVLLWIYNR